MVFEGLLEGSSLCFELIFGQSVSNQVLCYCINSHHQNGAHFKQVIILDKNFRWAIYNNSFYNTYIYIYILYIYIYVYTYIYIYILYTMHYAHFNDGVLPEKQHLDSKFLFFSVQFLFSVCLKKLLVLNIVNFREVCFSQCTSWKSSSSSRVDC